MSDFVKPFDVKADASDEATVENLARKGTKLPLRVQKEKNPIAF